MERYLSTRVVPSTFTIRTALSADIAFLAAVIRASFRDVAERFDLTPENCPTHPSNCTAEWIETAFEKGVRYYILEIEDRPCGCVALEQAGSGVCYLERLAILPEFRQMGLGTALVNHALDAARKLGASRVEIGVIAGHLELVAWYKRRGFVTKGSQIFEHLPFRVTFMFRELGSIVRDETNN